MRECRHAHAEFVNWLLTNPHIDIMQRNKTANEAVVDQVNVDQVNVDQVNVDQVVADQIDAVNAIDEGDRLFILLPKIMF